MSISFVKSNQEPIEKPKNEPIYWRVSVYPVVKNEEGKILMVVPEWNEQWELPGGGVEIEEKVLEGMERECYEETGFKIKATASQPLYQGEQYFYGHMSKKFFHCVHLMYEAKLVGTEQHKEVINSDGWKEIRNVEWKSLDELNEKNVHPIHWPTIKLLKEKK